jgi:hypothetical protein
MFRVCLEPEIAHQITGTCAWRYFQNYGQSCHSVAHYTEDTVREATKSHPAAFVYCATDMGGFHL